MVGGQPANGKTSIFKRMNCFKPQNSEENPLLLMNKGQSPTTPGAGSTITNVAAMAAATNTNNSLKQTNDPLLQQH